MKKLLLALFLIAVAEVSQSQDLSYYLPDSVRYDPAIPKPKDIIHHEVGEWHVTHDRLVNYMQAVAAAAPARVRLETMGYTYEKRPQVLLIITSPRNQQRLETIRKQHLQLCDPSQSGNLSLDDMPIVVWIGHSIHGNEQSGSNAALVTAYYLAAAQGAAIDDLLDKVVILFDPSFNPDGMQRFSTWVNEHKSKNLVSDPNDREFNEVWPGGRYNHYWFDLNRDWLPAVHIESQNRLRWFHQWKPNILTDHHEQGSNATFFFQPGVPSRVNPLTPAKNQELTAKLATFHAHYLDRIGSLYFTKESYDDFYYGKGSTYPDINGAIGILFEQASSRGHLQQTANGLLSFPFTIRNQFVTALSTLEGARSLRKEFLEWQRTFYKDALREAAADPVKGYVFDKKGDSKTMVEFVKMLQRHQVAVYEFTSNLTINDHVYDKDQAYIVPLDQPQYKVIKTIFSKTLQYRDSIFYDITAWTMPLAFGLHADELNATQANQVRLKTELPSLIDAAQRVVTRAYNGDAYAYLIPWENLEAPALLYELLARGVAVKVATTPFQAESTPGNAAPQLTSFQRGTLVIPAQSMDGDKDHITQIMREITSRYAVPVAVVKTGQSVSGSDLGSAKFVPVSRPSIAMLVGPGVNATDAGEIWHLLDQRMNIPATHLEIATFNRIDPSKYSTIIMAGGNYADLNRDKLKAWVQGGGVLIVLEEGINWTAQNGISDVRFKKAKSAIDTVSRLGYTDREALDGAQTIYGAIFGAEIDRGHPLAYGYTEPVVSLFKANRVFLERSKNPFATPFYYGNKPLQSGWVSRQNSDAISNSAAVVVNTLGSGRVINIADNPNFRAFWLGGTKLFMNAIFFGRMIDAASARTED